METDQQRLLADEKEEENSYKKQKITQIEQPEISVDKAKSTVPLQHTKHKAQSTSLDTERSKETDGKMPLFGNEWQNTGAYDSVSQKEAFLGTEESKCFSSNMHKFQGKEPFICIESSSKETSCLMSNVHGTEASGECDNTTTSNPQGKISLIGVRRQKNGRYGAVITDTIRHKQVWLGTFDTVEEASQAYFNKKLELENEKLKQQCNKENKPKENLDEIQQPESPIVKCSSVANDQTLDTAGVSRINSHETTTHILGVQKNNWSREEPESSKETSCLMAKVHGTESSNEFTPTNCRPTGKRSLLGIRKQKTGRYGAVITDQIRHKQVWLGTFDTVEEASQAYFSKKIEFEKLSQQGNKDNKPKENCDQIQQPELPVVLASLSVVNDQTLDTAGVDRRIKSHETTPHIIEFHKNKMSEEEPESSKETPCLMASVHGTESSDECNTSTSNPKAKIRLIGVRRQKNGRYGAVITDTARHKKVWLGTFDTVDEASQAYFSKKSELENEKLNQQGNKENRPKENCDQIQQSESSVVLASLSVADVQTLDTASVGMRNDRNDFHKTTDIVGVHKSNTSEKEPESSKETSCLKANVHGTESTNECNTTTSILPTAKRSLLGIRRQKNGRYGAVIRDQIRHKQVWLGTFDTVEEASQAYFSKKTEFEKLSQQVNKDTKPKENCDQIQQPGSPVVLASLSVANDQTSDTATVGKRNRRIDSHETTTHFVEVHKNNMSGKEPESSKETPCLMASVRGTESSDECNTITSNPKAKIGLIGVRRQKNGRYGAVIRDRTRHKQVWLGTFDTVEEASQAYLSKKSELKKLDQQNNKENKPKKSCDQVQQPESPVMASSSGANRDQTLNTAQVSRRNKRIDSHKTTPHFLRVHQRKDSGKYTSEIKNPITKKRIWLGTFVTAEEAYQAYQSKKLEFQKLVDAKGQCGNEQTHSKQDGESEKLVNVKQEHENVNSELESAGGSEIDAQISNSSNGVTEQRIDSREIGTAEEVFYAYLSKKFDLQSSEKVKLQNDMPTDSSTGEEKQEGQEDDEDLWMGEWVQLPGNRAVKFSLKLGLPIIDNYGSLLGEFSTLDDLSIYRTEDENET